MINASLTSRIVGAIVVLSLGIIFIPVLLETNKIDSSNMDKSPIPDIPSEISTIVFQLNDETGEFEELGESPAAKLEELVSKEIANSTNEVEMPELAPDLTSIAQDSDTNTNTKVASNDKKVAKSSNTVNKNPQKQSQKQHSWMLQVASFKNRQKALDMRDKLRAQHYVTHVEERKQGSNSLWRVRIGPDLSKSKIQKIQATLEQEMGIRGLIIRRR